jgi:transposase InsO family protein
LVPRSVLTWLPKRNRYRFERDQRYADVIRDTFEQYRETDGSPRITAELRALGHRVSEEYVARLMREMGLVARQAHKRVPKTRKPIRARPYST